MPEPTDVLIAQAERARRERDALVQLARDLAGGEPSTRRVLLHLAESAQTFTDSDGACVLELRDEVYRVVAPTGVFVPYDQQAFRIMDGASLFREVLATQRAVLTNEGQRDPRVDPRFRESLNIQQLAVAPIIVNQQVDGLLMVLNTTQPDGYSPDDALLLQRLADFSAVALRDAALVQRAELEAARAQAQAHEAAVSARRSAVLARTANALANTATAEGVYAQIGEIVGELLNAGGFSIYEVNVEEQLAALTFQTGIGVVDPVDAAQHFWNTRMAAVVQTGVSTFVDDMANGSDAELLLTAPLRAAGVGALGLLPLRIDGVVSGALSIRFLGARDEDAAEHAFLESFAAQVAVALRNTRHASDLQARAQRLATLAEAQRLERTRAEAAADIARAALGSEGLQAGTQAVLEILERVAPSRGKALGIARARDGRLEYVSATGSLAPLIGHRPAGTAGVLGISPDGSTLDLESLREHAPDALKTLVPDERVLVVPLMAHPRALGVLLSTTSRDGQWCEQERTTLERLGASIALAVEALLLDEEERHAREREVMLATALTTLDHPVFILEQGVIRYANPASARQYGWTALELVGRTLSALVVDAAEGSTDGNPTPSSAEQVHRRADGSEFSAVLSVSPLRTDAGVVHGSVVSVRDVSHDRAVAEQLRHSEKMVALGELVAGVAHEINNPLTSISAFAELLLEDALTAEQLESVKLIKQESDRATSVIRDLLLFARKGDAATGPIDINQLVDQTLRVRTFVLRNAQIDLEVLLDTARPIVQGDAHRLQQVLLNLLTNAEHALRGRTLRRLTVSTRLTAGRVEVCVADTGHGMSPLVRRRLFEPFFTTKPPGAGTGLGLSMSYGIAQAHHGTLEVHSDEGVGTTVTLILPAASHPDFSAIT